MNIRCALAAICACAAVGAAASPQAHQHGSLKLDIAIDGPRLSIAVEAPLDSLLGFERAPRSAAEKRAAADVLARLRHGGALFTPDAAAQCTLSKVDVQAGVLDAAAKRPAAAGEHADLQAGYEFTCGRPVQLRTLQTGLFEAFARVQRIDVQVAGPRGQRQARLVRPARTVELQR